MKKLLLTTLIIGAIIPASASAVTLTFPWGSPGYCSLSRFNMYKSPTSNSVKGNAVLSCYRRPARVYADIQLYRSGILKDSSSSSHSGSLEVEFNCRTRAAGLWSIRYHFWMKDARGQKVEASNYAVTKIIRCS